MGTKLDNLAPTVEDLEGAMLVMPLEEQVICPLKHHFSPGVYVREITMPAGSVILGHEHTTTHLNIISKGSCILVDVDTQEQTELIAPCTFESGSGVRKLLYIIEECVWSTVHVTEETDILKLEQTLVKKSTIHKQLKPNEKYIGE